MVLSRRAFVEGLGQRRQNRYADNEGNVVPDFDFEPKELVFEEGANAGITVKLFPVRAKEVVVKEAYANHRSVTASVAGKQEIRVQFEAGKWVYADGFNPHVSIKTDSVNQPILRIEVKIKSSP